MKLLQAAIFLVTALTIPVPALADIAYWEFVASRKSSTECTISVDGGMHATGGESCLFRSIHGSNEESESLCLLTDDPEWYDTDSECHEVDWLSTEVPHISCSCTGKIALQYPCEHLDFDHICESRSRCGRLINPHSVPCAHLTVCPAEGQIVCSGTADPVEDEVYTCGCRTVGGGPAEAGLAFVFLIVFALSILASRRR